MKFHVNDILWLWKKCVCYSIENNSGLDVLSCVWNTNLAISRANSRTLSASSRSCRRSMGSEWTSCLRASGGWWEVRAKRDWKSGIIIRTFGPSSAYTEQTYLPHQSASIVERLKKNNKNIYQWRFLRADQDGGARRRFFCQDWKIRNSENDCRLSNWSECEGSGAHGSSHRAVWDGCMDENASGVRRNTLLINN